MLQFWAFDTWPLREIFTACCISVTVLALQWYRKKLSAFLLSLLQSTAGALFCSLVWRVGSSLYLFLNSSQSLFSHAGVCSGLVTSASFPQRAPCCPFVHLCVAPTLLSPWTYGSPKGMWLDFFSFFKLEFIFLSCFCIFCIPFAMVSHSLAVRFAFPCNIFASHCNCFAL